MTTETDRTGRPVHRACLVAVLATVAKESRPSRDPHDLACRVAADRQVPAGVDGYALGRRGGELADRLAIAAEAGVSVRDLPADAVAELRALTAEQGKPVGAGKSR